MPQKYCLQKVPVPICKIQPPPKQKKNKSLQNTKNTPQNIPQTPKYQIITHKNLQRIWGEIHLAQFGEVNHCGCGAKISVRICIPRVMILKENVWTSKTFVKD